MKDLSEYQLRHLAVVTNRLAAMDGRALFHAMQRTIALKRFRTLDYGPASVAVWDLWRYARSLHTIRAELARRGIK